MMARLVCRVIGHRWLWSEVEPGVLVWSKVCHRCGAEYNRVRDCRGRGAR